MYAISWYRKSLDEHILIRDPLGQKPLYIANLENDIIYSSELRAILNIKKFEWRLDRNTFARFLFNSYYSGEDTPIQKVKKLLPGHYFRISRSASEMVKYWNNEAGSVGLQNYSMDDALDQCGAFVAKVMCYEHEVGCAVYGVFLSGGLDSALIFDFCKQENPDTLSFNVAASEADFDESDKAQLVCKFLGGTKHQVNFY